MTPSAPKTPDYTRPWFIGVVLLLLGFLSLVVMLGWFRYFEVMAIIGGIGVLAAAFGIYAYLNPHLLWAGWAAYLMFSAGLFFGVGFALDFRTLHYLAWGVFLAATPFVILYVRRVVGNDEEPFWWTALVAGGMFTIAITIIQPSLGWPSWLLPGVMTTVFMGGMAGTVWLGWLPNQEHAEFNWMVTLSVVLGMAAIIGILLTIDMLFLAIPIALLIAGAYFLLRFFVMQGEHQAEQAKEAAQPPKPQQPIMQPPAQTLAPPANRGLPSPRAEYPPTAASATQRISTTQPSPTVGMPPSTLPEEQGAAPKRITLTCPATTANSPLPLDYTCLGANLSLPLHWSGIPAGTVSLALIMDSPDAPEGIVTHWLVYDMPPTRTMIPAGASQGSTLDDSTQGKNDFERIGYDGPCPPAGRPQTYLFTLFALNTRLNLPSGASRRALSAAMNGHIIGQGETRLRFTR